MSLKARLYLVIIIFASLFPVYFLLMALSGADNLFLRYARVPYGFLMISSVLLLFAFAFCWLLILIIHLKRLLIRPRLGEILVAEGYITKEELKWALSEQSLRVGEVLINEGHITDEELNEALDVQKKAPVMIGEILKEMGYVTDEDINEALVKRERRIGKILIDMGILSDHDIGWALSKQRKPSKMWKGGLILIPVSPSYVIFVKTIFFLPVSGKPFFLFDIF